MTEQDWLTTGDAFEMAGFISRWQGMNRRKAGRRKLRLFGCALCRQLWEQMTDPRSRQAVETAERLADGLATKAEVEEAHQQALEAYYAIMDRGFSGFKGGEEDRQALRARGWLDRDDQHAAQAALLVLEKQADNFAFGGLAYDYSEGCPEYPIYVNRRRWEADALRCLFGNPFKPVTMPPGWRTEAAQAMAARIYADKAFAQVPILADALLDAGCSDLQVLEHCRSAGVHVPGCWVVDLVLGKQ
jgi:hypothetical protein